MRKELVITIIILIFIFGLNYITQKNTDKSVGIMTEKLELVRTKLIENNIDKEKATFHMNDAFNKWEELDDVLAYYIEHDELEKVKTALTSARTYIEVEEYTQSIEEIDKCIYILDHIHEREMFNLDNIF